MSYFEKKIKWVSDSNGNATEIVSPNRSCVVNRIQTAPGANGDTTTNVPTINYDATITDILGEDIAVGNLANRSNSIAQSFYSSPPVQIVGDITINISNAGVSKEGLVIIAFFREII